MTQRNLVAAAPCPMPLIEKARALDITYTEGWGMSETCALGVSSPAQGKNKPGGIGVPMADYDIRLVDPDTLQDVPRGEPGEIWIKGPTVKSFIQLVDGETVTVEEIIAFCKENLAGYKVPTQIEFREELPRTETGKAVRRKLRAEEMAKIEATKEK